MATTHYELLELAEKHADVNSALGFLIATYNSASLSATSHNIGLKNGAKMADFILFSPDAGIPSDFSDVVLHASKLSASFTVMNRALMDIACVLEKMGIEVDY